MIARDWIALIGVLASLTTPAALAIIGFKLNKRPKHFERSLDEQKRTSETRFQLYKDIGFKLNDIYSYFLYVGSWKDHTPADVIVRKRELDRHVYTYRPVFSAEFNKQYDRFISACFSMFGGWGKDASLRTFSMYRKEGGDDNWSDCFTQEDNCTEIMAAYKKLLSSLASDLNMKKSDFRL
ncbi:hypothetical protein [Sphingomonas sp. Leaf17]|uniref:hypothetical protein n=1 Tax=Sphingomonas sp. Leaf17 TaxID=1735683 RepID=UPI0012E28C50|nr:hypothetical protein [Sphingomonas sp. Leaf17]